MPFAYGKVRARRHMKQHALVLSKSCACCPSNTNLSIAVCGSPYSQRPGRGGKGMRNTIV